MIYRITLFILLIVSTAFAGPTQWRTLEPGLQYTQVYQTPGFPIGAIHAFKLNLKKYRLGLVFTKNNKHPLILVKDLVITHHALLGINGGFFSPDLVPLGLRIKAGKQLSPIKHTSWWGVFYIKNNRAYITSQKRF